MPVKGGKATPNEKAFVRYMAETGNHLYAARMAGYADPPSGASRALARPAVQEEIRRRQAERLNNDLLPAAISLLEHVLRDEKEATRNRIAAAKIVIDRTLGQGGEAGEDREPHEMTPGELQARIDRLRREQADRAKPILEGELVPTGQDPGVFD